MTLTSETDWADVGQNKPPVIQSINLISVDNFTYRTPTLWLLQMTDNLILFAGADSDMLVGGICAIIACEVRVII